MARKLKYKELKPYREAALNEQKGIDPISHLPITDPVLDHDHVTGHIRQVLQRETNAFEGKAINAFNRYCRHLGISAEDALIGLIEYWILDYSENPIHPKHLTDKDKLLRKYKRLLRRSKRECTKEKYRKLILGLK
tara:strand:- start:1146 stop:1553 length:408 start_codon:yes stop_codon:yes gene_type:complete